VCSYINSEDKPNDQARSPFSLKCVLNLCVLCLSRVVSTKVENGFAHCCLTTQLSIIESFPPNNRVDLDAHCPLPYYPTDSAWYNEGYEHQSGPSWDWYIILGNFFGPFCVLGLINQYHRWNNSSMMKKANWRTMETKIKRKQNNNIVCLLN
jgi:hypothetical protein